MQNTTYLAYDRATANYIQALLEIAGYKPMATVSRPTMTTKLYLLNIGEMEQELSEEEQ